MKFQDENSIKIVAALLDNQPLQPVQQYKDLKFQNQRSFKNWLTRKARIKVEFEDKGQDIQMIWLDENGELLHADLQSFLKPGFFFRGIFPGKSISIYDGESWSLYSKLVVSHLVYIEKALPRNSRVFTEKLIMDAIKDRVLKPGAVKTADAYDLCRGKTSYCSVSLIFSKVMMKMVDEGAAEKLKEGTYWVHAKSI